MDKGLTPWQIANGTTDGWDANHPGQEFDGIRSAGKDIAQERAMLIARTESTNLQDAVHTEAFKRMGVTVVDVVGCEDEEIMPGENYGCNSTGIPLSDLPIKFHPNHLGAIVPADEGGDENE